VVIFVVMILLVMHLPLVFFIPKLLDCRYQGLYDFGGLVFKYDRAFEHKWLNEEHECSEPLLGHADIQALPNIAAGFEHANEMRTLAWDKKTFVLLIVASLLPMIPLIGTQIPISEILKKLAEVLG
jgi:hypothetical protein